MEKKEKKKVIGKIIIFFASSIALVFIGFVSYKTFSIFNRGSLNFLDPQKIKIDINSIYSLDIKDELTAFVSDSLEPKKITHFDLNDFDFQVKEVFKIVRSVSWDFTNPSYVTLRLRGADPICKINNEFVLADNSNLFELEYFKELEINKLENVTIEPFFLSKQKLPQVCSFLEKVPVKKWEKYELNFLNNNQIVLSSKKNENDNKKFLLFSDEKSFFEDSKTEWAHMIENILKREQKEKSRKKMEYFLDIRFKNRIYVSALSGGIKSIKNMGRG